MTMAKNDKKNAVTNESAATAIDPEVLAFLEAQGISLDDFEEIGGFAPIISAKDLLESGATVFGYLVGMHAMPPRLSINPADRKAGVKEDWDTIYLCLAAPAEAKSGDDVVTVKSGEFVRIPVTGNLRSNEALTAAATHPDLSFLASFRVKGKRQIEVGQSEMYEYVVSIVKNKPVERSSKRGFALNEGPGAKTKGLLNAAPLNKGDVVNANGQSAGSLVA